MALCFPLGFLDASEDTSTFLLWIDTDLDIGTDFIYFFNCWTRRPDIAFVTHRLFITTTVGNTILPMFQGQGSS